MNSYSESTVRREGITVAGGPGHGGALRATVVGRSLSTSYHGYTARTASRGELRIAGGGSACGFLQSLWRIDS